MALCTRQHNFTFAVFGALHETFFLITKEGLSGILGKHMNRLLGPLKKRRCSFRVVYSFGRQFENGSFEPTSLLYEFEKKTADFYYRTETYFQTHRDKFEFSYPMTAQHFQAAQFIDDTVEKSNTDLTQFLRDNVEFIGQLLATILLVFLLVLFFVAVKRFRSNRRVSRIFRITTFRRIANNFLGFDLKLRSSSEIGLLFLCFDLFLFLFINLLNSRLSTEQVVVDTSHIINSHYKLLTTRKTICWFKDEIDYQLASQSPKDTFLYKVFKSKQLHEPIKDYYGRLLTECKFSAESFSLTTLNILFKNRLSHYFILMNRTTGLIASALLSRMFDEHSLFVGERSFYEIIYVAAIRKTLDDERKQFLKEKHLLETEAGLYYNLVKNFDADLLEFIRKSANIYTNVESYIDDQVDIQELRIEYFKPVFIALLIWGLLLLLALCVSHLKLVLKRRRLRDQ